MAQAPLTIQNVHRGNALDEINAALRRAGESLLEHVAEFGEELTAGSKIKVSFNVELEATETGAVSIVSQVKPGTGPSFPARACLGVRGVGGALLVDDCLTRSDAPGQQTLPAESEEG